MVVAPRTFPSVIRPRRPFGQIGSSRARQSQCTLFEQDAGLQLGGRGQHCDRVCRMCGVAVRRCDPSFVWTPLSLSSAAAFSPRL
eukprot:3816418-Pleurochrysis_carterae.AAC.1